MLREGREGYRYYDRMGYDGDTENISLDGYMVVDMFCGKEEHFPFQSLREALADYMDGYCIDHFEMGYQDGEKMYVYLERE